MIRDHSGCRCGAGQIVWRRLCGRCKRRAQRRSWSAVCRNCGSTRSLIKDDSGPWLRKTFPKLFYITSPGTSGGGGYHFVMWSGISGDRFHGRFVGADFTMVDNPWLDEHIRSKGPLGAQYPKFEYLMEGDTPSFLYLINNGLGVPEKPDWGSWGGRYEFYTPPPHKRLLEPETRPFWTDADDEVLGVDGHWHTSNHATIWRWRTAYQNDFSARMDWTIKPLTPRPITHPCRSSITLLNSPPNKATASSSAPKLALILMVMH